MLVGLRVSELDLRFLDDLFSTACRSWSCRIRSNCLVRKATLASALVWLALARSSSAAAASRVTSTFPCEKLLAVHVGDDRGVLLRAVTLSWLILFWSLSLECNFDLLPPGLGESHVGLGNQHIAFRDGQSSGSLLDNPCFHGILVARAFACSKSSLIMRVLPRPSLRMPCACLVGDGRLPDSTKPTWCWTKSGRFWNARRRLQY